MPRPRTLALTTVLAASAMVAPALAQPIRPFTQGALHAAHVAGQPVLIDAFAPWCPTCRAQAPTIEGLANGSAYRKLVILRLDYDHQAAEKRALGITKQSTLIAFKGGREVGRTLGDTSPPGIRALAAVPLK